MKTLILPPVTDTIINSISLNPVFYCCHILTRNFKSYFKKSFRKSIFAGIEKHHHITIFDFGPTLRTQPCCTESHNIHLISTFTLLKCLVEWFHWKVIKIKTEILFFCKSYHSTENKNFHSYLWSRSYYIWVSYQALKNLIQSHCGLQLLNI